MFMEFIDENGKSMGGVKFDDSYGAKEKIAALTPTEYNDFYEEMKKAFVRLKEVIRKDKELDNNVMTAEDTIQ